jgi:predicted amino acid racemase
MPQLQVNIEAISRNSEVVAALLRRHSLALVGVTKGCLGEPRVAAAMLAGGAVALADTRDQNLGRLRSAFPRAELHRIHLPSLGGSFDPADITYISSRAGAMAVAALGSKIVPRRVMLQVDTGDEREGVPPGLLLDLAGFVAAEPRLVLEGVATNYACFRGRPDGIRASLEAVAEAARSLRSADFPVTRVSGGNSSVLWLLVHGQGLPAGVTELRCGEALLLGQDALHYESVPGCRTDACVLRAEVLEEYTKPAAPGRAHRLVLGIGRQDLGGGAVKFLEPGLMEVGRSADYLVVEAAGSSAGFETGRMVEMLPTYEALVAAWTSPYVEVRFVGS